MEVSTYDLELYVSTNTIIDCVLLLTFGFFPVFGIGSLIHTGIEIGGIFEIENNSENLLSCGATLNAARPFLQLVFIFSQMYFIFLNQKVILKDTSI